MIWVLLIGLFIVFWFTRIKGTVLFDTLAKELIRTVPFYADYQQLVEFEKKITQY